MDKLVCGAMYKTVYIHKAKNVHIYSLCQLYKPSFTCGSTS